MKRKLIIVLTTLLLSISMSTAVAHADSVTLTINAPAQFEAPGGTVVYLATVSAPADNAADVYLNGDDYSIELPGATIDDSPFLDNFPFYLAPGQSYTGDLFDLTVPLGATLGTYDGTFVILGGSDGSADSILSTADFRVTVTPEPSSILLLGTGLLFAAIGFTRRQRTALIA
jgi:hypothetical protein